MRAMPLRQLRNLDIKDGEQEKLAQIVVNEKMKYLPPEANVYRGDVPDIKTKEDEDKWQVIIDAREAKIRNTVQEPISVVDIDTTITPVVTTMTPEVSKSTGCNICLSKGKRHKTGCIKSKSYVANPTQSTA